MQGSVDFVFDSANGATWLTLGVGLVVTFVVFVLLSRHKRRLFLARAANEDLPWEKLLAHLQSRSRAMFGSACAMEEDMPPEQFLALMLTFQPGKTGPRAADISPGERQFREQGGVDRRTSRRRWGNPTEVYMNSPSISGQLRGLIINRSAPGLAIFVNQEIPPGTTISIRATEAPTSIPSVDITVRYCRKTLRNFILGCQSPQEFPWNVRGWFG
jgi:hypothetical protein